MDKEKVKEIENLKDRINNLTKEVEELLALAKQKENKRWRANSKNKYYFINDYEEIDFIDERNCIDDDYRYKTRNYFKTKQEAQELLEKINTYWELADLAEELNEGKEINWENEGQYKYYIDIDKTIDSLTLNSGVIWKHLGQIYCLNEDFLEVAKARIGKERLIKLFK